MLRSAGAATVWIPSSARGYTGAEMRALAARDKLTGVSKWDLDTPAHVLDLDNGARFETYAIEGERGSGVICINGAAARLISEGDAVIILTYRNMPDEAAGTHRPILVYVDSDNRITRLAEEIAV